MEKFKLKIYSVAKKDLYDIADYINSLSPDASKRQFDAITQKISTLAQMPERCPLLKDTNLRLKGYRTLNVNNYIVFFVIKGETVQIRRILYGKRNYEWLL